MGREKQSKLIGENGRDGGCRPWANFREGEGEDTVANSIRPQAPRIINSIIFGFLITVFFPAFH